MTDTKTQRNVWLPDQLTWFKALRSGKYNQTEGYLWYIHSDDERGWCCLDVATNELVPNSMSIKPDKNDYWQSRGLKNNSQVASSEIVRRLKLFGPEGGLNPKFDSEAWEDEHAANWGHLGYLTELNDNGETFKEIVKLMRRFPYLYFKNFDVPKKFQI